MWEKEETKRKRYEEINKMWGANPDEKDNEDMRITSTKINGLSCVAELSEYIIGSKQFNSDINCFQEINIDTNRADIIQEMRKAIRDVDEARGSTFQTLSPKELNPSKGKPINIKRQGGTMFLVLPWLSQLLVFVGVSIISLLSQCCPTVLMVLSNVSYGLRHVELVVL